MKTKQLRQLFFYAIMMCMAHFAQANLADKLTFSHIGNGKLQGNYSLQNGVHKLSGAGYDTWNKSDNCDFASVRVSGDVQIIARILNLKNVNSSSKAGIMFRNTCTPGSMIAAMYYSVEELSFDYRVMRRYSGRSDEISTVVDLPYWVKLIRKGDMFISQRSVDGKNWHTVQIKTLMMEDTVYCGLAVTSQDTTALAHAEFDHLSIEPYNEPLSKEMQNSFIKTHDLHSKFVKDSFRIFVGVPLSYDKNSDKTYPAAYHLDGGDVEDHYIIRNFMTDQLVPEVITIGIGYTKTDDQRERDYRGGFEKFYSFMKEELIPFIDSHYKTDPNDRTLSGYSYGGLCCFQTLFKYGEEGQDMPFQGILAGSPALWWAPSLKENNFAREKQLYMQTKNLPLNFYTAMGTDEGSGLVPNFKIMTKTLKEREYQNFNLKVIFNEGLNHGSNKRVCYREGYLWLLNQPLPPKD